VEGLPEVVGVDVVLEIGGGTAFVTPVPNLPEFKIYNAQGACQKEQDPRPELKKCINTLFTCGVGGAEAPLLVVV
jgi:hypothetical protein